MTWTLANGLKWPVKGLRASGPQGLDPLFTQYLLTACESVIATDSLLTVNLKPSLSSCHASKIVDHNDTTLISALTQAVGFRSCMMSGGSEYEWKTATISHLAVCDNIFQS
jgi:hypothetical protein